MASETPHSGGRTESCEHCGEETPHTVTIELWVENTPEGEAPFDRQPHRVSTCRECGSESTRLVEES